MEKKKKKGIRDLPLCIISLQHDNRQAAEMRLFINLGFAEVEKRKERSGLYLSVTRRSFAITLRGFAGGHFW